MKKIALLLALALTIGCTTGSASRINADWNSYQKKFEIKDGEINDSAADGAEEIALFEQEQALVQLYQELRATKDPKKRARILEQIAIIKTIKSDHDDGRNEGKYNVYQKGGRTFYKKRHY